MKWFLFLVVLFCVISGRVNCAKTKKPPVPLYEQIRLQVESPAYKDGIVSLNTGISHKIACRGRLMVQKLEWFDPEGGVVLNNAKNRIFVMEPQTTTPTVYLVITETEPEDSGIWECRSGDRIEPVALCIMDPISIEDKPKEITADEQRSITLTCQTNGDPEPLIDWYKDGELLQEDDDKYFTGKKYNQHGVESLLTITSLTPDDMGVYTCKAVQKSDFLEECNSTAALDITLNVNYAPRFPRDMKNYYTFVEDGDNVTMVCNPSAYPKPKFRWFTGNMATEITSKYFNMSKDGSSLQIIANSQTYNKNFTCKAKNDFGEEVVTYRVVRMQAPEQISATYFFRAHLRTIFFEIIWDEENMFPVDKIEYQYFEKTSIGEPTESDWSHNVESKSFSMQNFEGPGPTERAAAAEALEDFVPPLPPLLPSELDTSIILLLNGLTVATRDDHGFANHPEWANRDRFICRNFQSLLHVVCGRRAAIIEQRRDLALVGVRDRFHKSGKSVSTQDST
ncbi:immunoglobulin i-set domain-containing protein [Phthorimaea operculella]|nr:immunoglobulin i-set domain-containing protein [Phthorimaea operculella]